MRKNFTLTSLLLMVSLTVLAYSWHPEKMNPDDFENYFYQVQKVNKLNRLKSVEVKKQQLDSVVAEGIGVKDIFVYDSNGNMVLEETYSIDASTGAWQGSTKDENTYTSSGYLSQKINYTWNEDNNGWLKVSKTEEGYDQNFLISSIIVSIWDGDGSKWENSFKGGNYKYDAQGNILNATLFAWDSDNDLWVEMGSSEYIYDANGNMLVENNNFVGTKFKDEYTYDSNGFLISDIASGWDETDSVWSFIDKSECTYTADGKDYETIYSDWVTDSAQWIKSTRDLNIYDDDNNILREVHFLWDDDFSSWASSTEEKYVCDNSYSVSDLILPLDCEFCSNQIHKVLKVEYYSWDNSTTIWDHGGDANLYYSEHDYTAISELNKENIRVFPNPAADFVTITLQQNSAHVQFELFDIQGHKVLTKEIVSNQKISLKRFSGGLYFYNVLLGGEKISGKLIKQ